MKSNTAAKKIRLFTNTQLGKPKRVKTVTDDYGNRVHVIKTKNGETRIKNSGATGSRHSLSQGKKLVSGIQPKERRITATGYPTKKEIAIKLKSTNKKTYKERAYARITNSGMRRQEITRKQREGSPQRNKNISKLHKLEDRADATRLYKKGAPPKKLKTTQEFKKDYAKALKKKKVYLSKGGYMY